MTWPTLSRTPRASASLDLDDVDGTRRRYRSQRACGAAKLAIVVFTRELAQRMQGTGVTASVLHPGLIATDISRDSAATRLFMGSRPAKAMLSTPDKGAEPLLHLATHSHAQAIRGHYFHRLKPEEPWEHSVRLTGLPATDSH